MNNGMLRLTAVLAVLLLAGLGLLLVLDLIPREQFADISVKGLLAIGIIGAAGLVVGLLVNSGNTDKS